MCKLRRFSHFYIHGNDLMLFPLYSFQFVTYIFYTLPSVLSIICNVLPRYKSHLTNLYYSFINASVMHYFHVYVESLLPVNTTTFSSFPLA